jgi:hypothetical protein
MQITKKNKEKILEAIKNGNIDDVQISFPDLVDDIILCMNEKGLVEKLNTVFEDKRRKNKNIPIEIILILAITAKMKIKTSTTDIPYAITDAELLSEIGYNLVDNERDLDKGIIDEGTIRNLINKYDSIEFIELYNKYIQEKVIDEVGEKPNIHILDCTKVCVDLSNNNYEKSEVVKIDGETYRGYKLASIRGLLDTSGIIEEIEFGSIKTHDLELSREMIKTTKVLKEGDILINDRGFISRDIINDLKTRRKVDVYVPAKKNMEIYKEAVKIAINQNKWAKHPNKKRKTQEIQLVKEIGVFWQSDNEKKDVEINACVVWDKKNAEYYVFLTTDESVTAKQIIKTYELRPEIEEDYRQIKDFWQLENFKSTKHNHITFHIVMLLIGYSYFQIYKNTEEGNKYARKSLPVILKNYNSEKQKQIIIYSGMYFGIFNFLEFLKIYSSCDKTLQEILDPILAKV